jgi:hypothetical protein
MSYIIRNLQTGTDRTFRSENLYLALTEASLYYFSENFSNYSPDGNSTYTLFRGSDISDVIGKLYVHGYLKK